MRQSEDSQFISSKELMERTNISRATLNNYIKMGIIPRPVVKKPFADMGGTKRVGYFPESSLTRINEVHSLKKEGFTMAEILDIMKHEESTPDATAVRTDEERQDHSSCSVNAHEGEDPDSQQKIDALSTNKDIRLDIDGITAPAYLINYKFEIDWINSAAEEVILKKVISDISHADARNIFRLFFNWEFQNHFKNWVEMAMLHMAFFKEKNKRQAIPELYEGISQGEIEFLQGLYDDAEVSQSQLINQNSITMIKADGNKDTYRVYTSFFREGILFILEPRDTMLQGIPELLQNRGKVINDLLQRRMPTLIPFCVMVADLQESCRICAELPPEEYFELINQMWNTLEECFKKYYGLYGKHVGDGMVYYFLKERDSNYIENALSCALEIKEKMEHFSAEWKMRKKWFNELYLNIGLNQGEEYFSAIHASTSVEFTALGETINYAARISDLARCGAIFTTKHLIGKLKEDERKRFRIGVLKTMQGREVFVENTYSRVIDLVNASDPKYSKLMDIAALPVTEVVGTHAI